MTRLISEIAQKRDGIKFHITSLNPIRFQNKALDWEIPWLKSFENGVPEQGNFVQTRQGFSFRYMAPLIVKQSCLECHKKQGYKLAEIRGGISVTLPFGSKIIPWPLWISHIITAILGVLGILFHAQVIENKRQALLETNTKLEEAISKQKSKTKELHISRAVLEKKNTQMEKDLDIAWEVQKSTINKAVVLPFLETEIVYKPLTKVSGDIYNFSLNQNNEMDIFLGDVTGHGVAAAFTTLMVQNIIDGFESFSSTSDCIRTINQKMALKDNGQSVTGVWMRISKNGLLRLTNAGHPPVIVIPMSNIDPIIFNKGGLPIGLFHEEKVVYEEQNYNLQNGDRILLYTDGLIEWGYNTKEQFGLNRLIEFAKEFKNYSLDSFVNTLLKNVHKFSHGEKCHDDLTLIGMDFKSID